MGNSNTVQVTLVLECGDEGIEQKEYEVPEKVSVKIGCDYSHAWDEHYERTKEIEYTGIIGDAKELANYLLASN